MSSASAQHLTAQQAEAFVQGRLNVAQRAAVERHVANCPACSKLVGDAPTMPTFHPALSDSVLEREREFHGKLDDVPAGLRESKRYKLLEKLGEGGMGDVYRALQVSMQREVALKVMKPKLMAEPKAVERFRREVRAMARLHEPNLVPGIVVTHDAEHEGDTHFVVMELVHGVNLSALVKRRGPLPTALACNLMRQAAAALHHAHGKGMVHRDVKPLNMMVTKEGRLKVLDFGLVRMVSETNDGVSSDGQVMGTADYMAPEQAQGQPVDNRADIYSLGCTLYFLLTGRPPFGGDNKTAVLVSHVITPPPRAANAPPALAELTQQMMAKRPEDRPTLPAVARELRQIAKGAKGDERTAPLPEPDRDIFDQPTIAPTRRRPDLGRVVRGALLGVLGLAVAVFLAVQVTGMLKGTGEGGTAKKDDGLAREPEPKEEPPPANKKPIEKKNDKQEEKIAPGKKEPPPPPAGPPREFVSASGGKMLLIKGGLFQMGSPEGEKHRSSDEMQHWVTVSSLYLGETEVTQKQFQDVMGYNPSQFARNAKGRAGVKYQFGNPGSEAGKLGGVTDTANFPVENVSWDEAKEYCERLNKIDNSRPSGWVYRLPREAEWEYSCRSGDSSVFHFGDILNNSTTQANFNSNNPYGSDNTSEWLQRTRAVKSYPANQFGLFDMHGNVYEWCDDWYGADYYATTDGATDPRGPPADSLRVLRGGSWDGVGRFCRSASRNGYDSARRYGDLGFRVALVPQERR